MSLSLSLAARCCSGMYSATFSGASDGQLFPFGDFMALSESPSGGTHAFEHSSIELHVSPLPTRLDDERSLLSTNHDIQPRVVPKCCVFEDKERVEVAASTPCRHKLEEAPSYPDKEI